MRILVLPILLISLSSFSQTNQEKYDTAFYKTKLTQYMFTCHSLIASAVSEQDVKLKYYLGNKAESYYNWATNQFNSLREHNALEEKLKKDIGETLQAYSLIIADKSKLFKPEVRLALQIMESVYKIKILPKLWNTK